MAVAIKTLDLDRRHVNISWKYPYSLHGRLSEIPNRRGVVKAKCFKGKYEVSAKLEFPEGWLGGGGGRWSTNFWKSTMYNVQLLNN